MFGQNNCCGNTYLYTICLLIMCTLLANSLQILQITCFLVSVKMYNVHTVNITTDVFLFNLYTHFYFCNVFIFIFKYKHFYIYGIAHINEVSLH